MDPTDLQTLAQDLLDAAIEALDTIPLSDASLLGAPERAFVSPGLPALDCCDQLAVHAQEVLTAPFFPGGLAEGKKCAARKTLIGLQTTITRCIPTMDNQGNPPDADEMTAAAEQTNADAWALWNHIFNLVCSDLLFTLCGEVFWDGLRAIAPQGGCGGWVLSLRVSLEGYSEPALS